MKKSDKWIVIRCSVDDAWRIEQAVKIDYDKAYLSGQKTHCLAILSIWRKLTRLLEIDND